MKKFFLVFFSAIVLMFTYIGTSYAEEYTGDVTNLVIFVKFCDDSKDIFNAEYKVNYSGGESKTYRNWDNIKSMYDENIGQNSDNSFKKYISVITEGKISVNNIFPQQSSDGKSVATYTLSGMRSSYMSSDQILDEIIDAINESKISCSFDNIVMDNMREGYIDNVTLIVQGSSGDTSSVIYPHKSQYAGGGTINDLKVYYYNIIPSGSLVTDDASIGVSQQQGVIAHEFLHVLGLPDLYRRSGNGTPVGIWDVMASNSQFLQYPLSYLRARQGWIDINWIEESGTYTLTAVSESGGNKIFGIKTPLSDTEYIMLEYRKKNVNNYYAFEHSIPSSGLLMYRVDTKVEDLTNIKGDNYLYVYRPDVSDPEDGTDVYDSGDYTGLNKIYGAALEPSKGETSYGSIDLAAQYTDNTLYYSDGSNSGIRISNVELSSDETQVTFDISFADYDNAGLWNLVGNDIDSKIIGMPYIYSCDSGVYVAYSVSEDNYGYNNTRIKKWNNNSWQQIGNDITSSSDAVITESADTMYLSCVNSDNGHMMYYKLNNGSWVRIVERNTNYPQYTQMISDGINVYGAYQENISGINCRLVIVDVKNDKVITESITAKDFANPAIVKNGNKFYLLYSDFFGSDKCTTVKSYNTETGIWSTETQFETQQTNTHKMVVHNGIIYAFAGKAGEAPVYAVLKDNKWTSSTISSMIGYVDVSMDIINGNTYVTYTDSENERVSVLKGIDGIFSMFDNKLGMGYASMITCNNGSNIYVALVSKNTYKLNIKSKKIEGENSETVKNGLTLDDDGVWRYYDNGTLISGYTGMAYGNGRWWYVRNGTIDFKYTGMAYGNGRWWYFSNGAIDFKYTGMAYGNGRWWYFSNGSINFKYTGMAYGNGRWWYFSNGAIDFKYTGTAFYKRWWYFENGSINFKYTGMAYANNSWWYFTNGSINFKYTGIGQNKAGKWYFQNGQIAWKYSGNVICDGKTYKVQNGKITG